jgi:uncharacterized protein (DUF1697 family)
MKTYVALLRGVNVGGRKVLMQDLRELFEALDAEDVSTYVQSGNVIFRSDEPAGRLVETIEERLRSELGVDVTVLLRTPAQLAKLVAGNPFLKRKGTKPTALHVTFLNTKPAAGTVKALDPTIEAPDEFQVVGKEVYLHFPNGYGRSKLGNAWFEKQLGVRATTRNWRTVTELAERSKG